MRLITILSIICLTSVFQGKSQTLSANHCDSSILTQQEYEKCKIDTLYNNDIIARTNYIVFLKTELLPKYRAQRKALILPDDINVHIKALKTIYDSTTNYKLQRMAFEMDRNQKYIQPKAYISTLLALETFKFYPDTYAVLLNEIHLSLNPRTDFNQMKQIKKLIDKIYSSLNTSFKDKIQQITTQLTQQRRAYTKDYFLDMFQGNIADEERSKYNIINFLLWTE